MFHCIHELRSIVVFTALLVSVTVTGLLYHDARLFAIAASTLVLSTNFIG